MNVLGLGFPIRQVQEGVQERIIGIRQRRHGAAVELCKVVLGCRDDVDALGARDGSRDEDRSESVLPNAVERDLEIAKHLVIDHARNDAVGLELADLVVSLAAAAVRVVNDIVNIAVDADAIGHSEVTLFN